MKLTRPAGCLVLISLLLLLVSVARGQDKIFEVNQLDERHGLSSRLVHCMMQDSKGFMWFGTSDGLNRYDGHSFLTFRNSPDSPGGIAANYVTALAEDHEGNIWIGFYTGGISRYNPRRGEFDYFDMANVAGQNLAGGEIKMLYVDQQNLVWIAIKGEGLISFDPKTEKLAQYHIIALTGTAQELASRKTFNTVYRIHEHAGHFYVLTHNGLYTFQKKTGRVKAVANPLAKKHAVPQDLFISFAVEGDLLWLGSWAGGLSCFDTKSGKWKFFRFDQRILPTTNIVSGLYENGSDTLWLTSIDRGFGYFNKRKETFTFLAEKQGFPAGSYNGLLAGRDGMIWLNTANALLTAIKPAKPFNFVPVQVKKRDHSVFHSLTAIIESDTFRLTATLWADGLQVYNKLTGASKALPVDTHLDEPLQRVNDLYRDSKGTVWVISRDVIYKFDPGQEKLVKIKQPPFWTTSKPSNFFLTIREDADKMIWIASARNGLFRYDQRSHTYTHYAPMQRPLGTRLISAIDTDEKGKLWAAGMDGYLAFYDKRNDRFVSVPLRYKNQAFKNASAIFCQPGGRLYVGTESGLLLFDIAGPEPKPMRLYTGSDGLKGDIVSSMQHDASGNVWCITQTALCRIDPKTDRIDAYGLRDGIEKPDIGYAINHLPNGYLAVTANNGYYRFRPASFLKQKQDKAPVITSFKVYDKEYFYQKELSGNGFVRLEPDENSCSFEFSVLDFKNPDSYQYYYKFEGMDADWVRAGNRRYVAYTNIPGGKYTFKVKAVLHPDDLAAPELSIPFYVETIFYSTWWFRMAVVFACMGVGYVYYRSKVQSRSRIYQLQSRAATLEKEKAMVMYESLKQQLNPHFLFNSLTSLGSLIWIDQKLAVQFLESLSKMYRYILKNRDIELVLLEDEIQFVQMYIGLQQTRFPDSLHVKVQISDHLRHWKIVPVTLQNLIENAIKHNIITAEDPLDISIYTEHTWLIVQNNLQKKKFVQTSNRQGLTSLVSLYKYLSERQVEIVETQQTFTVKIPLI